MRYLFLSLLLIGCSNEEEPKGKLGERIKMLDERIDEYEKKAMNDEVEGMGAFRENYSKFAREMEESEENEEKVRNLSREKEALLEYKEK